MNLVIQPTNVKDMIGQKPMNVNAIGELSPRPMNVNSIGELSPIAHDAILYAGGVATIGFYFLAKMVLPKETQPAVLYGAGLGIPIVVAMGFLAFAQRG